jgi:hypothetical protein
MSDHLQDFHSGGPETSDVVSAPDEAAAPQGFLQRLSNSFGAILFGLICIPIACWALFANEGRAVRTARALAEGQGIVQTVNPSRLDPAMNGRLVHVSGEAKSAAGVTDDDLRIRAKALTLVRKVEMFQWVETESGSGQDRKFSYAKQWADRVIDSTRFRAPQGHGNPSGFTWQPARFAAKDASIGAYLIGAAVQRLSGEQPFRVTQPMVDAIQAANPARRFSLDAGRLYRGVAPDDPFIGEERLTFTIVPEGPASFVGRQTPTGIEPYRTSNGREILLAQTGHRSPEEMFGQAQDANAATTWLLRALGLFAMFIAFNMLFSPVKLLASYVPVLGNLVSGATSLVAAAATALVGPLVIAIAWFAYRPFVSGAVLAVGIALAFGFRVLRQRKQAGGASRMQPA